MSTETIKCNLCCNPDYEVVLESNADWADVEADAFACTSSYIAKHGRIVRCTNCGLVYANPRPTQRRIEQLYREVEDKVYLAEEEARIATFRHSLTRLRLHEQSGRLLDVGCYIGAFLRVARAGGFETAGVEPSEWASSFARGRGLDVHTGSLEDAPFEPGSFDVVTVWDVVEHYADPKSEMLKIRELLRPDGLLAISTMDVGSFPPRLMRGGWPWYMLMHLYYFTPATLTRMLEDCGYVVVGVEPHVRVLTVRYAIKKASSYSPVAGSIAARVARTLRLDGLRLPLYFGDLFTIYARRT